MDEKIREMRQAKGALLDQADTLLGKPGLSAEERSKVDELIHQAEELGQDIERHERVLGMRGDLKETMNAMGATIGMSQRELGDYSLMRAINAAVAARSGESHAWDQAGLELEASRTVAKKLGRDPKGFYLPLDVQLDRRDLTVGTSSAGGYLKQTSVEASSFIEMLRNRMVLRQAGAIMLSGLVGDVAIPAQTGGATAYWVAESGAPSESQQTVGQVLLQPKTVGAYTDISRKLLKQSSLDVELMVRSDLAAVLALAIDAAGLHGLGSSNQPTGVDHVSGIGAVYAGNAASDSTNANGANLVWADVINLETEVAVDSADVGSLAYITNARVRGFAKRTMRVATYGDRAIWDGANNELNGYRALVSSQCSATITKGGSSDLSALFFGNWADLVIAMWGGLDILVDPYTGSTSGTVRVVAFEDADIGVRHAQSFAVCDDIDATTPA